VARRPVTPYALVGYVLVQAVVVVAFLLEPEPRTRVQVNVIGDVVTVAFAAAGILLARRDRLICGVITVALALLGLGDEIGLRLSSPDGDIPYPSIADLPYAIGSVTVAVAFVLVAVRVGAGPAGSVLDTALASSGLVVLAVQFGIAPALFSSDGLLSAGLSALYATIDVVGIVVATWCLVSGRGMSLGVGMVALACIAWYAADVTYAVEELAGNYFDGGWLDLGWYIPNALLAATCWIGFSTDRRRHSRLPLGSRRLLLAGAVGLTGPVGLGVASAMGVPAPHLALLAATVVPVVLALLRAHGLLRALEHQAHHDGLTGLLNRTEFAVRAEARLASGSASAVLVIDVDGFKRVNDTFGHATGDLVLIEVAQRLTSWTPSSGLVGRLGGDEFAVIVPRDAERFRADREQLTGLLTVRLGGQTDPTPVTSTVGLVELDPQLRRGFDEVLAEADAQMYLRKRARASAIPVQATPAGRGREA
jgi:diguanylate cyclase (GGDEF)-like protein